MSLAALGCNPQHKGTSLADIGNVRLGTLAYSPDGGLYMAVRARGAVTAYTACTIRSNLDVAHCDSGDDDVGWSYCIPQVALADDEYGWGLVFGHGLVRVSAHATTAGESQSASIQADGLLEDADGTDDIAGIMLAVNASTAARNNECFVMFPKKAT